MDQRPSPPRPAGLGRGRTALLTGAAMLGFAANSILCRLALIQTTIDPAVFTAVRIAARAAAVQLSVPVITVLGAAATLGEGIGLVLAVSSAAVLGGIALVIAGRRRV
ncbi:hypothetical protein J2847_002563 [Azospirillum agricola]|uniref:hypothetical protein n=1 Tax=Azospirillum agricola TaxID=1720247 RepID=UPI001AE5EE4F|nr:hypothetical protein [Azospirillum agricola]MBP2229269.1 hypothetical protein [Azospirillum agricola]